MKMTTSESIELFYRALEGSNFSPYSIRAYTDDVKQFVAWVEKNRVDWDEPTRFGRGDIVEFLSHLASLKVTGVTRVRKLAALRKFFTFLRDNSIIAGNPAETVKGVIREQKDPEILYRNEYKALLYEAQGSVRDYAMLMVFLQTGIREGELVNLKLDDIDLDNKLLVVRQGKGKKDRGIPLEEQALKVLRSYLKVRASQDGVIDHDTLFLAKNGTSLDVRTVRWTVQKYLHKAGIGKKASVHTLRHTFGTHKIHNGMSITNLKELMGHKKTETTLKYIHLDRTTLREQQEATGL